MIITYYCIKSIITHQSLLINQITIRNIKYKCFVFKRHDLIGIAYIVLILYYKNAKNFILYNVL